MGLDQTIPFTLKLHEDPDDMEEYEYTKEDKNLTSGNSGVQSLFAEEDEGFTDEENEDKDEKGKPLSETEKLKKKLEEAGLPDAFKGREGSNIVRPQFDEKGRLIDPRTNLQKVKEQTTAK
jgi:hypothetical protein